MLGTQGPQPARFARSLAAGGIEWTAELNAQPDLPPTPFLESGDDAGGTLLRTDIEALVRRFCDIVGSPRCCVRLAAVRDVMCRRFHTDYISLRLLCTYAGLGTQWIADDDVDRAHLGHRAIDADEESLTALRPAAVVRRVPKGAVVLLKGDAWPGNAGRGAIHRSPDPGPVGRLLLRIDAE